jgi:hypothetical protein
MAWAGTNGECRSLSRIPQRASYPGLRVGPRERGRIILERTVDEETHFVTMTFWRDELAIRQFAGDKITQAKYYSEDKDFLLEFEPEAVHYEVVGSSTRPPI